jgi:predicted nucleic acid-binding protein
MEQYLIDNNVISNYFAGQYSDKGMIFIAEVIDSTPNISVITKIEALSWVALDKNKEEIVKEFISDSNILELTPEVVLQCVKIRRSKKIKTPDAIIAATAIINNLILITNDRDFKGIQKLHTQNPFDL